MNEFKRLHSNFLNECQLLINSTLSIINPTDEVSDSFEEAIDRQVYYQFNTEETVKKL